MNLAFIPGGFLTAQNDLMSSAFPVLLNMHSLWQTLAEMHLFCVTKMDKVTFHLCPARIISANLATSPRVISWQCLKEVQAHKHKVFRQLGRTVSTTAPKIVTTAPTRHIGCVCQIEVADLRERALHNCEKMLNQMIIHRDIVQMLISV